MSWDCGVHLGGGFLVTGDFTDPFFIGLVSLVGISALGLALWFLFLKKRRSSGKKR